MIRTVLFLLSALLFSCSNSVDVIKESQILLETDKEFAQMSLDKGAAAAFEFYMTEDAMVLPHKGNPINGRDGIVKAFGDDPDAFTLAWTPQKAEVSSSGDMGWTWGKFKQTLYADGDDVISYGKYLNIWEKQNDGSWRLIIDMGNNSPEPEKQ